LREIVIVIQCDILLVSYISKQGGFMMAINRGISLYVTALFLIGFFFFALPQLSNSQEIELGCCQYGLGAGNLFCADSGNICPLPIPPTTFDGFFPGETCNQDSGVCTGLVNEVPTLSEWGLIATAGILGIAGFMVIRRRKATA
jgi:hypothetical protein